MEFVQTKEQLIDNIRILEKYLLEGNEQEKEFAYDMVRRGKTIVVYKVNGENHFAPSRFIGYKNNCMDCHLENDDKDGRETNPVIDKLIGRSFANDLTDSKFVDYCNKMGIEAHNNKRRFWRMKDGDGKNLVLSN